MNGTIDTVKYLEESCSLNKSVSKRIENEAKEKKKAGFLSMLTRAGEETIRCCQDF